MKLNRWLIVLGFFGLCGVSGCNNSDGTDKKKSPSPGDDNPGEVRLEIVKLDPFLKTLKGHLGKVVLLDIWGEF